MTRCYQKVFKTLQRESKHKYKFSNTHPGHGLSHLTKSKHATVPRTTLPKRKMCPLKKLDLSHPKPTEQSLDKHEMYAKMALLMFYPVWCLDDLTIEGSYWETFSGQLWNHLENKETKIWQKGFEILKNINDRLTLEKELKCAKNPIFLMTNNKNQMKPSTNKISHQNKILRQTFYKWS